MSRAIQVSHASVEHYGPDYLAPMIRDVFGGPITLDPASSAQANVLIGAENWFGPDWAKAGYPNLADGLNQNWFGNVYLNPPGRRILYRGRNVNQAALWWAYLADRFERGFIDQAVFMVFNLETLRYAQEYQVPHPFDYTYCLPKSRIDFWKPGPEGRPVSQGSPGHPNAIIYMGPRVLEFRTVFADPWKGTDWEGGRVHSPNGWWERYQT